MATDHLGGVVAGWATLHWQDWRCRNPGLAERFEAAEWRLHRQPDAVTIIEGHEIARTVSDHIAYSRLGTDDSILYITRHVALIHTTMDPRRMLPLATTDEPDYRRLTEAAITPADPLRAAVERLKSAAGEAGAAIAECVRLGLHVSGSIGHKDNYQEFSFGYPGDENALLQVRVYVPERDL